MDSKIYGLSEIGEEIGDFVEYEELVHSKSYYYPILYTWASDTTGAYNVKRLITEVDFEYYPSIDRVNIDKYILHRAGFSAYGLLTFKAEIDIWVGETVW